MRVPAPLMIPHRMRAVFGTDGSVFDFNLMNSLEYDLAARDVVMQMVRDDPRAVVNGWCTTSR